ncbi:hypothetical protein PHISP_04112 [Aspergillus sp. HF37]|nr:hypothetical protein PHISP_04112 [Aspergillus sp. HF37]
MYPWNSPASGASPPAPPPRGGMIATSSAPSPAYPVQQLRWLPSMVADPRPSQHTGPPIPSNSSPNQLPPNPNPNPNPAPQHHPQQQPVSSTVGVALSDGQDSSPGNGRNTGLASRSASTGGYSAYTTSSNVPASVSAPAPAPAPARQRQSQSQNQMQMPMPIGVPMSAQPQSQPRPRLSTSTLPADDEEEEEDPATANSRRHGKRLTTKEEVLLFEICNAHAAEFGQRSNLCNWWRRVTDEFTRQHGQPYSWHSVRRKVELATKQRIKFLEGKDADDGVAGGGGGGGRGEDVSNPRWRAGVDAWIPTWQRWEQAEAKRIEKRDLRKGRRKRKDRSWEESAAADGLSDGGLSGGGGEGSNSNGNKRTQSGAGAGTGSGTQSQQMLPPIAPVKLPPGFDSMFQTQPHTPSGAGAGAFRNGTHNPQMQNQNGYQTPYSPSSGTAPMDSVMMGAMLETLGKLNKRLDATPANPDLRFSPVTSALVTNAESPSQPQAQGGASGPSPRAGLEEERKPSLVPLTAESWRKLKEELRQEMQADVQRQVEKDREGLEEKLDSVQRTQEMILDMLRQEP